MSAAADFELADNAKTLRFSGAMTLAQLGQMPQQLDELEASPDRIDLSSVERMDTVGAWLVHRIARDHDIPVEGATKDQAHLLEQVAAADQPLKIRPDTNNSFQRILDRMGESVIRSGVTLVGLVGFFGAMVVTLGALLRHPKRIRWNAVVRQFEVVGVDALGIIGLMSFLIGIVVAQQGAVQLAQFGAEVYTINLIGRITVRELGVLMTAIMVAGRSGSSFAAQIGTMKITEEIDAMRTIGVSPVEALVLPRLIACVVMMPLLGFWAILMSLLGGGVLVWMSLGIPPLTYIQRLQEVIPMTDMYIAMIKAPVFGFIIALAGCFQGMLVEGDSEQVGSRTTTAVVQSIFLVIVLDAVFAVFFSSIGWR